MHIPNDSIGTGCWLIPELILPERLILTEIDRVPADLDPIGHRHPPLLLILNVPDRSTFLLQELVGIYLADERDDVDEGQQQIEQECPGLG
jgi:hypothetical protein